MTRGALVVALAALTTALSGCSQAVSVDPPSPAATAEAACRSLLDALPDTVDGQPRRDVRPDGSLAAAWGDPAIVLRCGVERPAALTPTAQLVEVDGVSWFPEPLSAGYVFTSYGRQAFVEVTVPDVYAPEGDALVGLASAVSSTVPKTPGA